MGLYHLKFLLVFPIEHPYTFIRNQKKKNSLQTPY
jgi:hypothetical protein